MTEHAVTFGPLSGVLCRPEVPQAGAPAALMWNVGINHRVGAFRIWVDLARRLARSGITSLRFDLAGLGDSEAKRPGTAALDAAGDLVEAMAGVTRRTGLTTFAPVGFCSGVDAMHALGLRDARVVAMAYLEGYAWPTFGYWLRAGLGRLRAGYWWRKLRRPGGPWGLTVEPERAEREAGAAMFSRHEPSPERFAAEVTALRARGVKLLFGYFGRQTGLNHAGQFGAMTGLAPGGDLDLLYLPGADHTLLRTADRAAVVEHIALWLGRR